MPRSAKAARRLVAVASAIVLLGGVMAVGFVPSVGDDAVAAARWLRHAGALGVLAFLAAYAIGTIALVPDTVFSVAAGYAYGCAGGFAVAFPCVVASALVAFALARATLRRFARFSRSTDELVALDDAVREHGASVVTLVRVAPALPFAVANYLFAMTSVGKRAYLVGTALGMLPWTLVYAYLGSVAPRAISLLRGHQPITLTVVSGAVALIVAMLLSWLAHRALRRRMSHDR